MNEAANKLIASVGQNLRGQQGQVLVHIYTVCSEEICMDRCCVILCPPFRPWDFFQSLVTPFTLLIHHTFCGGLLSFMRGDAPLRKWGLLASPQVQPERGTRIPWAPIRGYSPSLLLVAKKRARIVRPGGSAAARGRIAHGTWKWLFESSF